MRLLHDIQAAVVSENTDLGPILLKLRLLASRLGSAPLEEWVKHESDGYSKDSELPDYRIISVSYNATFSGPFGSGIQNAPIAPYLIKKFAGDHWNNYEIRQSIAEIDDLIGSKSDGDGGTLCINASNLILLLQGKVYPDYACNAVSGTVSRASLAGLRYAVRSRVLEFTIELEKSLPDAAIIELGTPNKITSSDSEKVTQISQQIIYGNVTTISSNGTSAQIKVQIGVRDETSVIDFLKENGWPETDATEFAQIISSEDPDSTQEPFGNKARSWLAKNIKKAANGTWKLGVSVATELLKEAALKYYGLK